MPAIIKKLFVKKFFIWDLEKGNKYFGLIQIGVASILILGCISSIFMDVDVTYVNLDGKTEIMSRTYKILCCILAIIILVGFVYVCFQFVRGIDVKNHKKMKSYIAFSMTTMILCFLAGISGSFYFLFYFGLQVYLFICGISLYFIYSGQSSDQANV
ncbi:hypothetical protein ACKWTF_015130 [Chironomus riparius]